ncbi:MAG: type II toxin-antitoxin system VapC family toxin [Pyrinomonadaceae bacterium]
MISAIDTNIIVSLWDAEERTYSPALSILETASSRGGVMICGAVFGELLAAPRRTEEFIKGFLNEANIIVDWSSSEAVWRKAGAAFQKYAARRRRQNAAHPRRILTDFYIGAHALVNGYELLTLDAKIYRAAFPTLRISV